MAESDKADASTGKTKAKTSFLDDDISKDFLSSWKSTGGSDMDFNFEPVAKGNKKAFDFGMDMDFSLDDAFGKMSSFKLDMPDIDFSSSPKKSAVSKENKSESKPAKESGQEKNDKFTFSFDFDGFGDFSLDDSATKGGKTATEGKTSKQASSLSKIECEDLPNQAASSSEPRKEDATQKEHSKSELSEVAVDSKHGLSVEQEKSLGASSFKGPSNSTIAVHQRKQTQMSMNITVPVDALQPDPKSPMAGETDSKISRTQARAHDFSSNPESNPSHKLVDSEEAFVSPKTTKITSAEGVKEDFHFTEKKTSKQVSPDVKEQSPLVKVSEEPFASPETDRITTARGMEEDLTEEKASKQVFAEVKEQASMVKVSEEAFASPETDKILTARGIEEDFHLTEEKTLKQVFAEVKEQAPMVNISALLGTGSKASDDETCSPNEKIGDGTSEVETLQEEFATGALLGTDSITTNPDRSSHQCFTEKMKSEEERVAGVSEKLDNHTLTLDTLSSTISKRMNSEVSLNAKLQKSDVKDPPAPSESKPTSAKSMKMRFKLSEANNFSMVRGTNDGAGKKHFILEKSKKGSASLGTADLSGDSRNEGNGGKLDGNPSSCAKELMKRDSAVERREKRTDVSRDGDSNESGEIQTKMVVDAVLGDRQAKKDSFHLLDTRKISIDVKPYSIQLPSVVAPERETKSSNHGSGKLNDKISSISIAQNIGQVNRLLSARTDKTVPTLPSLKISRNTVNKQSASSIVQTPKSMVNFEKSARLEEKTKIVSPVNVLRQTPSVTSLKRKPTEVADPQPSKRHLASESRMSNVSPREVENEVKTRVTLCEGSKKNLTAENPSPKFDFHLEENMENLGFTLMVESDENVEKAEACAKELDDICSMLKKKHDEAKELLVRALVNNNNLLMLNHPIYEKKILEVQKFASRLMSREQAAGV